MSKTTKTSDKIIFHPRSKPKKRGLTCIDLFSGAGGIAEGLRQAGWSILSGTDIDPPAGETFRLNFPEASFFEGPISAVNPHELLKDAGLQPGELDCLVGGPPCQSFSYNNHQRSADNDRAKLFQDYLRVVKTLLPKALIMENVPGMLTIDGGHTINSIKTELAALGYDCGVRVLYAEDYGVPQMRRRVIIIASRLGVANSIFPTGTHGPSPKPSEKANSYIHRWTPLKGAKSSDLVTVWDAISDLPIIESGNGDHAIPYQGDAITSYQKSIRSRSGVLYNHACHKLSPLMLERMKHVSEGGNWTQIPRELLTAGMRRAHLNCHTKRYGRLSRTGLASTLLTKCDPHWGAYFHPTQQRTITVREAARLQGFPDSFRFAGTSLTEQYAQVGNAVPVPLAKALGLALKAHINNPKKFEIIDADFAA
jgi:DNA (cytosine-5)-methyltransferase 1